MIYLGLDYYLKSGDLQIWGDPSKHYDVAIADLNKVKTSLSYNPKRNTSTGWIFDSEKLKVLRDQLSPSDFLEQAAEKEKNAIFGVLRDAKACFESNVVVDAFDPNDLDLSQSRVEIVEGRRGEIIVSFKPQNRRCEVLARLFFALVFMGVTIGVEKGEICGEWSGGGVFIPGVSRYVARRGFESQLLEGLSVGHFLENFFNDPESDIFVEMKEYFVNSISNTIHQLEDVDISAFLSCQVLDYLFSPSESTFKYDRGSHDLQ